MNLLKIGAVVVIFVTVLGLAACGGGGADVKTQSYSTTLGQELEEFL